MNTKIYLKSITPTSATQFEVPSETKGDIVYHVDMFFGMCSCYQGKHGGPCKHQCAVTKTFKARSWNLLPVCDPGVRHLLYKIETGHLAGAEAGGWFRSPMPDADISAAVTPAEVTGPVESPLVVWNALLAVRKACHKTLRVTMMLWMPTTKRQLLTQFDSMFLHLHTIYCQHPVSMKPKNTVRNRLQVSTVNTLVQMSVETPPLTHLACIGVVIWTASTFRKHLSIGVG